MGNQATVVIRTDGLGDLRRNPKEFVDNLCEAIEYVASGHDGGKGLDFAAGCHANPARVIEVHHADSTRLISAGGSTAVVLGTMYRWRWSTAAEMKADLNRIIDEYFSRL